MDSTLRNVLMVLLTIFITILILVIIATFTWKYTKPPETTITPDKGLISAADNDVTNPELEFDTDDEQETFFSTGLSKVNVNGQGALEGARIFTNGQLMNGTKYSDIVASVKEGKSITDKSYIGGVKGDNFDKSYQTYRDLHEKFMSTPNAVRSAEEIDKMSRGLNEDNSLAKNNILSRGGVLMRVKIDPNGTVGVMEEGAAKQPERERNHTVYATNHVIQIPSFGDVDNHISGNWAPTSPGMSKSMSVKVDDIVSGLGENSAASAKVMNQTLNETFSE